MNSGPRPSLVDFHCHLDLYPDHAAAVAQREREGVFTLTVTTTPKAWPRNQEVAGATRYVRAALGLHPQLVDQRGHEISLWKELLPQTRYVGEVGLDAGPRYYKSFDRQKEIFDQVLSACASARGKVISVHSVRSSKIVLDMIEKRLPLTHGCVVLHWFTGTTAEARRAVDLGCYFSVNSAMLKNKRGENLVRSLPIDRVLTETDGPFTGDTNEDSGAAGVSIALERVAQVFERDTRDMANVIVTNLKNVLK